MVAGVATTGGWQGHQYRGILGLGKFFSELCSVSFLFFYWVVPSFQNCFLHILFWRKRTTVVEKPPLQVDTRLRWSHFISHLFLNLFLFLYLFLFLLIYTVFLIFFVYLVEGPSSYVFVLFFVLFLFLLRNARLKWLKKLRYIKFLKI